MRNGNSTPTNSYYTTAFGTAQGKAMRTVTAGTNVTISNIALTGTETEYNVSGITAYANGGLKRTVNDETTLYYGSGDQLSLTLANTATGAPEGYQYGYIASAGTLDGTTLTMPDEGVTISVDPENLVPQPVQRGDANGDGSISVTDIAVVVNCILQLDNNGGFSEYGADANGDEQVTVTDIGMIVDKILGSPTPTPPEGGEPQ